MKKAIIFLFAISIFAGGCATTRNKSFTPPDLQKYFINVKNLSKKPEEQLSYKHRKEKPKSLKEKIQIEYVPLAKSYGIKPQYRASKIQKHLFKNNSLLKISVENMPLNQFVKLVFNKILKVSFVVGKNVEKDKSKVTLSITTPLPKNEFFSTVETVLSQYGVTISFENNTYFISKNRRKNKFIYSFFVGRNLPNISINKKVALIFPVYYINPGYYAFFIKRLTNSIANILALQKQNLFIIYGKASDVKDVIKLIKIFDRPYFGNKYALLIKLNYVSPENFVSTLDKILPIEGIPLSSSLKGNGLILKPINEISSVLLISPKSEWVQIVKFWKNKLDSIKALGNKPRLFIFYPKNRRADELAKIFSKFGKSVLKKSSKKGKIKELYSPAKVAVDKDRNALVIYAVPSEYQQIKNILERLDTLPKQVFVQVTILEVTLTGKLEYGLEWYLRHSGKISGNIFTLGGMGLGSTGLNASIITDTAKFQALINAFAQKNLINVLSSPSLVVMDNKVASIDVGTKVPTVESESTSSNIQDNGTTALVRTIKYRNTGVILHIKPTINSNGIVTMTISQEVSDAQTNNTSQIDSPLILTRNIKTSVVLKSGTTLLLGGLIKKSKSVTVNKVPLLGNIPVVGNLFKTTSKSSEKTELIVEIAPYILPDIDTLKKVTASYKALMDLLR